MLIGYDGLMSRLTQRTAAAADWAFPFRSPRLGAAAFLETWNSTAWSACSATAIPGFPFVSRKNAALKRSLTCASAIGEALRGAGFSPSLYHADPIPGENKPFADRRNGVHYYDNLIVLKTRELPPCSSRRV